MNTLTEICCSLSIAAFSQDESGNEPLQHADKEDNAHRGDRFGTSKWAAQEYYDDSRTLFKRDMLCVFGPLSAKHASMQSLIQSFLAKQPGTELTESKRCIWVQPLQVFVCRARAG